MTYKNTSLLSVILLFCLLATNIPEDAHAAVNATENESQKAKTSLEFSDVFHFNQIKSRQLSEDGRILALSKKPYRGDPQGQVYDLSQNQLITSIDNASNTYINKNADWVAFTVKPSLLTIEKATKKKQKELKKNHGLVLVNTNSGEQQHFKNVVDFAVADNGEWLAYRVKAPAEKVAKINETEKNLNKGHNNNDISPDKKDKVYPLTVINLKTNKQQTIHSVLHYGFSAHNDLLAVNQIFTDKKDNQLFVVNMRTNERQVIFSKKNSHTSQLAWHPHKAILAYTQGNYQNTDLRRRAYQLSVWNYHEQTNHLIQSPLSNWSLGKTAKVQWSDKGERLYFDNRPKLPSQTAPFIIKKQADLFNYDHIRQQKQISVWHPKDSYIKPREEILWHKENKNRHYKAVYHLNNQLVAQLSTPTVEKLSFHPEMAVLLGKSQKPYLHQANWADNYSDFYAIDVKNGKKTLINKKAFSKPSISPKGTYAVYFEQGNITLKNLHNHSQLKLVKSTDARFSDDKHDYPNPNQGYGFAGWMQDESAVMIYSKYDIWSFNTETLKANRLTQGKEQNTQYRIKIVDPNKQAFHVDDTLYLSTHHLVGKQTGIASLNLASMTVTSIRQDNAKYQLLQKAKTANTLLFTKEDFHTFPDIYQTNNLFSTTNQVTNINPQVTDFHWGQTPELISYLGYNGESLQGTLIKPAGYQKGDKVPVVIYFYRYMSQRRFDFPKMELNHRPNLPMFTSNGYAIFLPDIRFEIGKPGPSSTQTMINAAQKLIDLGIAHPDKIGLQGHSWAGYQSAFMVTQTDMFKAVVSGAPVSNMTSAYGGIRLKSGKTRQFQYETGQSRIGKSLFDARNLYIENSPLFFADKVNTPILIMFGDKDDAVPWHEGVQYYLALQRAGKDAIFLQYKDEPHHLKQFANQVDFSIRMKEYFDHYLKGEAKALWMQQGEAYIDEKHDKE